GGLQWSCFTGDNCSHSSKSRLCTTSWLLLFFFFKQKTAYEIGLGIPAEPLFRSGFPFIQEPPSGDLQERVLIRHHDYDQCFQSVQLLQWNSQVKFNVTVYRNLPTTRDSIMTS